MKKIIQNLRQRPEEERRHILHISVFFLAMILIVAWSFSLNKSFSETEAKAKIKQDIEPFSALKDNIVDGYTNLSADVFSAETEANQ